MSQIRLGMVGEGQGAFIGSVHRIAARLDDKYKLIAGALTSDPSTSKSSALDLGIEEERSYSSYIEMAEKESSREDGIEAVSIVTPNHLHFPVAECFLSKGIHLPFVFFANKVPISETLLLTAISISTVFIPIRLSRINPPTI